MRRILVLLLAAVPMAMGSGASAASAGTCPNGVTTITAGQWPANIANMVSQVAMKEGFDVANCIKLQFKTFRSPAAFPRALVSGEIKMSFDMIGTAAIARRNAEISKDVAKATYGTYMVYTTAQAPAYVLFGGLNPKTHTLKEMLMGKTIAISRISWKGVGTKPRTDPPKTIPAANTQMTANWIRVSLPNARIFYGTKAEDSASVSVKERTVYLVPTGFGRARLSAYLSGRVDLAVLTAPQPQIMARDKKGFVVATYNDESGFPDLAVNVLKRTWKSPEFRNVVFPEFRKAMLQAGKWLAKDKERTAKFIFDFAHSGKRGSILAVKTMADARLAATFGMSNYWTTKSSCLKPIWFKNVVKLEGLTGLVKATSLYPATLACR